LQGESSWVCRGVAAESPQASGLRWAFAVWLEGGLVISGPLSRAMESGERLVMASTTSIELGLP